MLIDLNKYTGEQFLSFDICIIGAGAAGIALADGLIGSGLRVALLESGGFDFDPEVQDMYSGKDTGETTGMDVGRLRMFGGTTNHWGGRCARLDPLDFRARSWVPMSGWPIDEKVLEPYYQRAIGVCGFKDGWLTDDQIYAAMPVKMPQITSPNLRPKVWRFTPRPNGDAVGYNFGVGYRDALASAKTITGFTNATVTKMVMDGARKRVTAVNVQSLHGKGLVIQAKAFVLAAGGIENPRLLLNGDGQKAIGNEHDMVGRCFIEHPRFHVATLYPFDKYSKIQDVFSFHVLKHAGKAFASRGRTQTGLALTEQAQVSHKLMNCSIDFYARFNPGFTEATTKAKHDVKTHQWGAGIGDFAKLMKYGPELLHYVQTKDDPINSVDLVADLEQVPNPNNRVTLGADRDHLGLRRPVVNWTFSQQERETALQAALFTGGELTRLGYGRVKIKDWVRNPNSDPQPFLDLTYHFTGTTRMADDPKAGVVDKDCKVHSTDNLFIAGSSVFPTSGNANPTFTIIALTCRLADHLKAGVAKA